MLMKSAVANSKDANHRHFLKRIGLAGFIFFFLKGLLWLLVSWLAHSAFF